MKLLIEIKSFHPQHFLYYYGNSYIRISLITVMLLPVTVHFHPNKDTISSKSLSPFTTPFSVPTKSAVEILERHLLALSMDLSGVCSANNSRKYGRVMCDSVPLACVWIDCIREEKRVVISEFISKKREGYTCQFLSECSRYGGQRLARQAADHEPFRVS